MKIRFRSTPEDLAGMRAAVRDFLAGSRLDEAESELLVLALDEACTNVIRHAYCHACRPIHLEMERVEEAGELRFTLRDYGKTCDPDKIRSRDLADIRPGGVGVHIIRMAFDEVTYTPCPRGTRLCLVKKLKG